MELDRKFRLKKIHSFDGIRLKKGLNLYSKKVCIITLFEDTNLTNLVTFFKYLICT